MNSGSERTVIEALSANVLDTRFEDFDQATVDMAKNRIIDIIGATIGGAKASYNPELVHLVKDWGGKEESTIIAHGGKAPAQNVAFVNSAMARAFDFYVCLAEVEGEIIISHVASTTVPTALAMAEAKGVNGKELITAMLVGDDVVARLTAADGWSASQGTDYLMVMNCFGATAIAGRLLGLNKFQMRNAFGIALTVASGSWQSIWDGAGMFQFGNGVAARNGIFAAELAKIGWTGAEDALFSKYGLYHIFTFGCKNPEILTKNLGKKYYGEVCFKPYPGGRPTHGPVDCALVLVHKHDIKAEDIKKVTVSVSRVALEGYYGKPFKIGDFPRCDALYNYRYPLASVLIRKSIKLEHFSDESIRDPQIRALIDKMELVEFPAARGGGIAVFPFDVEVKVEMKDGREFTEFTNTYTGDPKSKPLSKEEIFAKFMTQVEFSKTVPKNKAEKLLKKLDKLEAVDRLDEIFKLAVV